jgi:hypothetical protein
MHKMTWELALVHIIHYSMKCQLLDKQGYTHKLMKRNTVVLFIVFCRCDAEHEQTGVKNNSK